MNHPTETLQPMGRAHVINDSHAKVLCLGDTAIVTAYPIVADGVAAKSAMFKFKKAAERINAELDETGHMTPYRALEISCALSVEAATGPVSRPPA